MLLKDKRKNSERLTLVPCLIIAQREGRKAKYLHKAKQFYPVYFFLRVHVLAGK